ncbi:MAG: serine/threonine-protein kinase [Kofleriaceae bacterium]
MRGEETALVIQVGQVLDKYELLERVGQGGMAVVYRATDRSLKRVVAVKILHKHLSDYQEARDRFEREAQAVAKLRHENILEIFDYSAKEGSDSYIVTEFIDGQTLKQFITERPIAFPEIGAMVILQVCRALAHAHAGSILHRDVKPENIMIRSDGVVKLMDFGISHMVDLERLTVTGQLLGSPAYMAPEHVEGRPLDFRTDVFAAGIVLYQLCVGKLPFEGKNPHEVLKRIAECKFIDPRQANPRIGNRLGRIILKAMAAVPDDRYAAIGEMVLALEAYLEESGVAPDKVSAELARYFAAPASYEEALKARLIETLTRHGEEQLGSENRAAALDVFDRVLTIDPQNEKVLAILDRLNRRARIKTVALAIVGVSVIAVGAYAIHTRSPKLEDGGVPALNVPTGSDRPHEDHVVHETGLKDAPMIATAPIDAAKQEMVVKRVVDAAITTVELPPDAAATVEPVTVQLKVFGNSSYRIGTGEWKQAPDGRITVSYEGRPIDVAIRNDCCEEIKKTVDGSSTQIFVDQLFKPAQITPNCAIANASVSVDGRTTEIGRPVTITFSKFATSPEKDVVVDFTGPTGKTDHQSRTLKAGQSLEVKCDLH